MRRITIGQYYQSDGILHRLDARVKLAGTLLFILVLFFADNVAAYVAAAVFLGCMIVLSTVPVATIIRGMRAVIVLLCITVLFNLFLTPGEVLLYIGPLSITKQGVSFAAMMAVRLFMLVAASSIMTLTTTPNALTDAMEHFMKPLKKLRVPVHEIAMMMAIALRFIPILMEETDKIMKAQRARGAKFDEGNVIQRAKSLIPVLVPLFVSAFRRANDLTLAMEARCYHGGDGRTKLYPLHYEARDRMAYAVLAAFLLAMILLIRLL